MGRWASFYRVLRRITTQQSPRLHSLSKPHHHHHPSPSSSSSLHPASHFHPFRHSSSLQSLAVNLDYVEQQQQQLHSLHHHHHLDDDNDQGFEVPVKAFFLSTSINLRSMQSENSWNVVPQKSRTSNFVTLRFFDPSDAIGKRLPKSVSCYRYMLVFQYGSTVLFNVEDHEVEFFLNIARRHASGLLPEMRKDDYAVKEKPTLSEDMQGGADFIVLKRLDTDGIRIIGSVLGQSIALDYFVSQVDSMVEEFAEINRAMEKTGTFNMRRKKLFQLVGKANSNIADIILKVGLFDRSEIAWREAKYAEINEYLREEYEVTQRFGNLDIKMKFVEHNIHFLQEVLQNRRSDLLEWCIIILLSIENVISVYELIRDSAAG